MKYLLTFLLLASSSFAFTQIKYVTIDVDQTGINDCLNVSVNSFEHNDIQIYPNPNEGLFTLEIIKPPVESEYTLKVYSSTGKIIYSKILKAEIGNIMEEINLSDFSGLFLISICSDKYRFVSRVMIN